MLVPCLFAIFLLRGVIAQYRDDDFMSFVTLPETRALKFEVNYNENNGRERVSPGYWFVAPYGNINPEPDTRKYIPYQVGPYIYDGDGMLIWTGSALYNDRNVFDFKTYTDKKNETHLTFIAQRPPNDDPRGRAVIMNSHYEFEDEILRLEELDEFNIHEFNVLNGGETAVACTYRQKELPLDEFGRDGETSWFLTGGFVEWDLSNKEILFLWDSDDHVGIHESVRFHADTGPVGPPGHDYVHINAVDKNADGNYLISLRFTNTIYLISHEDGHIIWRLGGEESDFKQDFTFSKQHDAKFVESNGTHHIISFLNNGGDEAQQEEEVSSALIVEVDETAKEAKVLKRYNRPDNHLTYLRGSVQLLPNDNVFVGWSARGYQTEFSPEGDNLVTAQFVSDRLDTYRAYKFDFVGRPSYPPKVVASVYGADDTRFVTTIYVSWNGATDIASWNFYAQAGDHKRRVLIGSIKKTDFENMFVASGYMDWISVEAVDREGTVLGTSDVQRTRVPDDWKSLKSTSKGHYKAPTPDDPSVSHEIPVSQAESMDDGESEAEVAEVAAEAAEKAYDALRSVEGLLIFILVLGSLGGIGAGVYWIVRYRRSKSYQTVPKEDVEDDTP